ncbi:regulatory subunit : Putative regulatory subunit (Fragment) OS=Gemmata sp. Wa1-1 PE=4 SV=1: Sigma70_r2: Sigma70_r4_2: LRR_6: LRR_6: LRR_6: LRR_6: LRR_6: LRR_6 [Gemmata massiliana]|uniref:Uncharacterized protein n=1 Tax=Gemmata massiliana TaxID=1210884 RepID=A0A6P2D8I0_9BACT
MSARLRRWLRTPGAGTAPEATAPDGELVCRFVEARDEAAFTELVRRHGPMVLAACRRVLDPDVHTADDAFQATFLVLASRAAKISPPERVGAWLHGVAVRVAQKARTWARKIAPAVPGDLAAIPHVVREANPDADELRAQIDDALAGLPSKYRVAVVLCELEGRSRKEAATALGWSEGTLSSRLARARKLLADRLARRGVTVPAVGLGAAATVPVHLAAQTTRTAALVATGAHTGNVIPARVVALARGVSVRPAGFKLVAAVLTLAAVALGGAGLYALTVAPPGPKGGPARDNREPGQPVVGAPPKGEAANGPLKEGAPERPGFDQATIDAWEKRGFEAGWIEVHRYGWNTYLRNTPARPGPSAVPAFIYSDSKPKLTDEGLKNLPPIDVPFALGLRGTRVAITDAGLEHLAGLKNLTHLSLLGTRVRGTGLKHLTGLKNLTAIELTQAPVTDAGLKHLADLKGLTRITLCYANNYYAHEDLDGAWLKHLAGLKKLTHLDLYSSRVTDEWLEHLVAPEALTHLDLGRASVTDEGLRHLAKVKNLTSLDLTLNEEVTDKGLVELGGLEHLADLNLSQTRVTGDGMKHLAGLKNLTSLNLSMTRVTDEGLGHLTGLKNLIDLNLYSVPGVTNEGLKYLAGFDKLTTLDLCAAKITDEGLKDVAGLKNLTTLKLCGPLTEAGLKHVAGLKNLTTLKLWCPEMSDDGLKHIVGLTKLTHLDLHITPVSDAGLAHLTGLTNLTHLDLGLTKVTDEGLVHLAGFNKLRTLNLSSTEITGSGWKHLAKLQGLTRLDLSSTKISAPPVTLLRSALPDCEIVR